MLSAFAYFGTKKVMRTLSLVLGFIDVGFLKDRICQLPGSETLKFGFIDSVELLCTENTKVGKEFGSMVRTREGSTAILFWVELPSSDNVEKITKIMIK